MKILVAFSGSKSSCAAVQLAEQHAIVWDAKLEIVNTKHQRNLLTFHEIDRAERELKKRIKELLNSDKLKFETHMLIAGETSGKELVKFARRNQIDEVIIGLGKRSKVGKLLFGSTAQYVILNAPCPVVTVH